MKKIESQNYSKRVIKSWGSGEEDFEMRQDEESRRSGLSNIRDRKFNNNPIEIKFERKLDELYMGPAGARTALDNIVEFLHRLPINQAAPSRPILQLISKAANAIAAIKKIVAEYQKSGGGQEWMVSVTAVQDDLMEQIEKVEHDLIEPEFAPHLQRLKNLVQQIANATTEPPVMRPTQPKKMAQFEGGSSVSSISLDEGNLQRYLDEFKAAVMANDKDKCYSLLDMIRGQLDQAVN